jgi:outer membrane cobalamin receptor
MALRPLAHLRVWILSVASHFNTRSVFNRLLSAAGAAVLGLSTVGPAFGEEQTSQQASGQSIEEITISANHLEEEIPQELAEYGTRVDTITAEQIQAGGYVDVAEALENLAPGLYLSPKNGPFDYVDASFQGSQTGDILWLVDGVRINNRLYNGTTPLDTLPASMVERIEIIEGGQALFYGTQAVAGAINIVTKSFSDKPDGQVSAAADTNNDRHFDGYARDSVAGNEFVVYGSGDKSSGFQPFRDQDYQPSGTDRRRAYEMLTIGAKYEYDFFDRVRLTLSEQHSDGRLDYALPYLTNTAYNDRLEDIATLKLDATVTDRIELLVKSYFHEWHSHYTEFDNTIPPSDTLNIIENDGPWGYKDYGVNVLTKLRLTKFFDYFVGYDSQNYGGSDAVLVITQHTESTQAVFGQIRTNSDLFSDLKLALGARFNDPSVGQSATVWNLSGQYDFTSALFMRGQVGTAFRLPTAEELFANDPNDERGNPALKPEESTNANLSLGGTLELGGLRTKWELIGFYRDVKDLIDYLTFDTATNQSVFGNVPGTVRVRGGELSLESALGSVLSGNLNYTYNHAIDPTTNLQIARVPVNLFKFGLDYHPTQPWGAALTVNHFGTTYQTGLWDGTESYGNNTIFDISARCFIGEERHNRIDFAIQNLLNRTYATGLGTASRDSDGSDYTYWNLGIPRTFRLSYTYHF